MYFIRSNIGRLMMGRCRLSTVHARRHSANTDTFRSADWTAPRWFVVGRSQHCGQTDGQFINTEKQRRKCHRYPMSYSHERIASHTRRADILMWPREDRKPSLADMIKEGSRRHRCRVNQIGTSASGKRILVGDVDFETVKERLLLLRRAGGRGTDDHHNANAQYIKSR